MSLGQIEALASCEVPNLDLKKASKLPQLCAAYTSIAAQSLWIISKTRMLTKWTRVCITSNVGQDQLEMLWARGNVAGTDFNLFPNMDLSDVIHDMALALLTCISRCIHHRVLIKKFDHWMNIWALHALLAWDSMISGRKMWRETYWQMWHIAKWCMLLASLRSVNLSVKFAASTTFTFNSGYRFMAMRSPLSNIYVWKPISIYICRQGIIPPVLRWQRCEHDNIRIDCKKEAQFLAR